MTQPAKDSGRTANRPRWLGYAQLGLIIVVVLAALYLARAPARVPIESPAELAAKDVRPTVRVIHPTPTEHALTVRLTGNVTIETSISIAAEVGGRVTWVSPNFRPGGVLEADESVVRLDSEERRLRMESARLAVLAAEAALAIETERAEAAARLFSGGRRPGVDDLEWVGRATAVTQAEARLQRARIGLELIELQIAKMEISVPFASRVIATDVGVGELVGLGVPLGTVYRTGALQVTAPIDPRHLQYLAPIVGRTAHVTTRSGTYAAEVERVSAQVDTRSRLVTVFLTFSGEEAPDSLPLPGSFAEAAITGPAYENVYVLPEAALQEHDSVWVVSADVLESVTPRILGRTADGWVVAAFPTGQGVVVGGLPRARDGLAVSVTDAAALP